MLGSNKKKCTRFYRGVKPGRVCGSWKVELGLPFVGLDALPFEKGSVTSHPFANSQALLLKKKKK